MAIKSQEILLKGNTTNASAVPSSLKVREIAINALDRSLFTNDGNSIVKLYTGTTKWFDVNGNANNALKADSVAWSGISGKPTTFTPSAHTHTASDVSGLPTSLKNPYALTFGSKTYDGSAAATITASDLGALTAHQSIYALTLQVNGTSKGVYNPASAVKTINIAVPTKTSDITNDSGFITSASIPTALKNPYAVEIKANGVSLGTYDGSVAATFNLSAANVGAANRVHSHTASEISGLPTNLSAFTNDVGYITGITKSMVEGVLTGDITSHTHSQYLTSALRPAKLFSGDTYTGGYYKIKINSPIEWMLSFDVKIYQYYRSYTIRFSGYNYNTRYWYSPIASLLDGDNTIDVKFGYDAVFELWVAIPAFPYAGINITNVTNGYMQVDTYALDQLFTITREAELSGTTQETITLYPPSKSDHTHTFASLTSKPTTIAGYGITDNVAYRETWNNFIHNTNEFTFASPAQKGSIYINYRTSSGTKDGAITDYCFSNGAGLYANLRAAKYIINGGTSAQFLKADGSLDSTAYLPLSGGTMSNTNVVTNLNADLLDGLDSSDFVRSQYITSTSATSIDANDVLIDAVKHDYRWQNVPINDIASLLDLSYSPDWRIQLFFQPSSTLKIYARQRYNGSTWGDWREMAFADSNVASATKLQTPRTIWGQSFDGNANVDGWFSSISTDFRMHYNTNTLFLQVESTALILGEGTAATIPTYVLGKDIYFGSRLGFNTMTITNGGNILIGTTTDNGYKLQVNGKGYYSGDLIVDGEVSALVA